MGKNRMQGVRSAMDKSARTNAPGGGPGGLIGAGTGSRGSKTAPMAALVSARRRELKLTLQRVADMVGCAKSYLWLIERGRAAASEDMLVRLQRALGFKKDELVRAAQWEATPPDVRAAMARLQLDQAAARKLASILGGSGIDARGRVRGALDAAHRSGELRRLVERIAPEGKGESPMASREPGGKQDAGLAPGLPLEVPLINSVAAGYPREFTDLGYPARAAAEYVRCPDLTDPDAFACRIVGDSMLPDYREGDIVVFSPAKAIKSGMDCFARIEPDHESTFKRVYLEGEKGEVIRLQPLNPAYSARTLSREQVAGLYAAVSVTRAVGGA